MSEGIYAWGRSEPIRLVMPGHRDHLHVSRPGEVTIEQYEDFATNTLVLRAVTTERVGAEIRVPREQMFVMTERERDELVLRLQASVLPQLPPDDLARQLVDGQDIQDLPGGLHNWPLVVMGDGDHIDFDHPEIPGEHYRVVFDRLEGRVMHSHVEWIGHGQLPLTPCIATGVLIREVIEEAMTVVSVARSLQEPL